MLQSSTRTVPQQNVLKLFQILETQLDQYVSDNKDFEEIKEQYCVLKTSFMEGTLENLEHHGMKIFTNITRYIELRPERLYPSDNDMVDDTIKQLSKMLFSKKILISALKKYGKDLDSVKS